MIRSGILGFVTSESLRTHLRRIDFIDQERKLWDRRRSDIVGPGVVQLTRDLLCWCVPSSLSGSGMCEDGFAGDDAPYAVCPSIDDNPEMPGTVELERHCCS